jgi:hypothetical protein
MRCRSPSSICAFTCRFIAGLKCSRRTPPAERCRGEIPIDTCSITVWALGALLDAGPCRALGPALSERAQLSRSSRCIRGCDPGQMRWGPRPAAHSPYSQARLDLAKMPTTRRLAAATHSLRACGRRCSTLLARFKVVFRGGTAPDRDGGAKKCCNSPRRISCEAGRRVCPRA